MKKHILGLAVATCAVASFPAQALHLSRNGAGQVLLFPYYTVNSENQTLISIVNSTDRGKAARLFFREGRNSRVAYELSLYLAPHDVWTASIFSHPANGLANIVTTDNSCTVPGLKGNQDLPMLLNGNRYAPFSNSAYTGSADDAGPDDLARTREGHFELIEMGEVINRTHNSLTAITHGSNGIPANCGRIAAAWNTGGYWSSGAPSNDLTPPGGGLYGTAYLIDALGGTMQGYAADAIENFSGSVLHEPPGQGQPTLASNAAHEFSPPPLATAQVFVDGELRTLQYPPERSVDAVSAVLMADQIHNEFVTTPGLGGASEWVVTFPTKHFYTDVGNGPAIAPFTHPFALEFNVASAPTDMELRAWSRAGLEAGCVEIFPNPGCAIFSPPPPPPRLVWSSNVLSINPTGSVQVPTPLLGSNNAAVVFTNGTGQAEPLVREGTLQMSFWNSQAGSAVNQQQLRPDLTGRRLRGLPVQGFWVASYTNGQLTPGVLSNYSDAVRHQTRASLGTTLP